MLSMTSFRVVNRHGEDEEISFDEIKHRINKLINFTDEDVKEPLYHTNASKVT